MVEALEESILTIASVDGVLGKDQSRGKLAAI